MYNTILVPLDGSKRAEAILGPVEELARHYSDARVILLQVIEPVHGSNNIGPATSYGVIQEESARRIDQARAYLDAVRKAFREKGIDARTRVKHGPVVQTIIHTADQEATGLIAMASHGRTGMSQVFYGSVAAGVLHRIDRPLLLIRSRDNE
jgi:nucleotide-binding universal stress UspA family protein